MKHMTKCVTLGLAVLAGGLAMATPASASVFFNRKATDEGHQICMGVAGGVDNSGNLKGNKLVVWACNDSEDQTWNEDPVASFDALQDVGTLGGTPACLVDTGGANDRGTQLVVQTCNQSLPSEEFIFTEQMTCINGSCAPETDGVGPCFRIQNQTSRRFIGVANAAVNEVQNGMEIIMWDMTASDDQVWCQHPDPHFNL
jgi:hypothetical protein